MILKLTNEQVRQLSRCHATTSRVLIAIASLSWNGAEHKSNEVIHKGQLQRIANVPEKILDSAIRELLTVGILKEHKNGIDYILNDREFCIG